MKNTTGPAGAVGSALRPTYRSTAEIADDLGMTPSGVKQLLRERALVAVQREGRLVIPGEFVADGEVVKGLAGTVTLLTDGGLSDDEIVDWLFTPDARGAATRPASCAMDALRAGRGRYVHRQAQVAGF